MPYLPARAAIGLLILAAIAAAGFAPARAATEAFRSQRVGFADLDLANPVHVRELRGRVRNAAQAVCAESGIAAIAAYVAASRCFLAARSSGMAQVDRVVEATRTAEIAANDRSRRP